MRILIAGSTYAPFSNGQAIFTANLAEQLAKFHHVCAIVPSDQGQTYHTQKNGIEIQYLWTIGLSFLNPDALYTPFPAHMIHKTIQSFKPDIVHIQDHYPLCYYVYYIAKKYGLKVIGTNHFVPENIAPVMPLLANFKKSFDGVLWSWMLFLYKRLDLVTAQSKKAVEILQSKGIKKVYPQPITCGVSLERFYPDPSINRIYWRRKYGLDPKKVVFLFVGRVDGEKRLDVIIKALHKLKRKDIQFAIAGRGASLSKLSELVDQLKLHDEVRFTGYIPNDHLPALLNSVDVFTMPSQAELLSIATLEAMATARPVLLADALALPELVTDGENGFLFKVGDVDQAAEKIAYLADHPELWEQMGAASLQRAQKHSLDDMRQGFEIAYQHVLEEASLPHTQEVCNHTKNKRPIPNQ